ncbi:hypothetical protein [Aneurinibacillus sp. REN35]|uniref:hypothetical protein n=1 Tax=Aneurinibacillus sp. REN35 TaxID=3237286 RepID=UPI003526DCC6
MRRPFRNISYLIFAFLLVLYGLPRLPILSAHTDAFVFSAVWLAFALLIIGALLYQIIGAREEGDTAPPQIEERERQRERTRADFE